MANSTGRAKMLTARISSLAESMPRLCLKAMSNDVVWRAICASCAPRG
jgi:hypothetical protein